MTDPSWTELVTTSSAVVTALSTLALALMAYFAWRTAKLTLDASRRASDAATTSAVAARAANDQARWDSIQTTRPYVYVEIVPSISGSSIYDIRIVNSGRSAARGLKIEYDSWPSRLDDIGQSVKALFDTPRTLPPQCSIRAFWRLEGNFTAGSTEAGLGTTGTISLRYSSDDPSRPQYEDSFDVMVGSSGMWPIPESGPTPDGLHGDLLKFYRLGQALVRRVGELAR